MQKIFAVDIDKRQIIYYTYKGFIKNGGFTAMVFDKVKELVADQLDVDAEKVTADANLQDDLGADSLDVVDLVMALEDEFEIEIPDEAVETIKTVGDIAKYIEDNQDK